MNVSFLHNNPVNSVIVNNADERPLYGIKTPFKWAGPGLTTTIRRADPVCLPEPEQISAETHWKAFGPTIVKYLGTEKPMKAFLRKTGGALSQCVSNYFKSHTIPAEN